MDKGVEVNKVEEMASLKVEVKEEDQSGHACSARRVIVSYFFLNQRSSAGHLIY